jgi:hypothetical protein
MGTDVGSKLIMIPATLLDAIERLLRTAPPPKTAKDKADRDTAKQIIKRTRKQRVEVLDEQAALRRMTRKKAGARKKAR